MTYTAGILYSPANSPALDVEFGVIDASGTTWRLIDVAGMDSPPTVGQVVQQAGDHGGWATPQYLGPRPITVVVTAIATSAAQLDAARAALQQAVPVSDLALFRLDETVPKQIAVRRSGPVTEQRVADLDVRFTIGLIAPDPRKYGTVLRSLSTLQGTPPAGLAPPWTPPITLPAGAPPMSVSCLNAGSFETRPNVVIQGPVTAPSIVNQNTGQIVAYSALTLGTTDVLAVDFLGKSATLNGAFRPADLSSAWWVMPPGTTGVQLYGTATTGASMTVNWRDAWI